MSRAIKFRAWVHHSKRMYHWEEMGRAGLDYWLKPPDARHELMQFTGLLDKNGREIYEGDIVRFLDNTSQGLIKKTAIIEDIRYLPDFICSKWQEVIGNIYEDPNLLGTENQS